MKILFTCTFLLLSCPCFCQNFSAPLINGKETVIVNPDENASGDKNPGVLVSAVLSKYEDRLTELQKDIDHVIKSYRDKDISRATAEDELKPLLLEQYTIRDNPEYRAEKAMQGLLSERMLRQE